MKEDKIISEFITKITKTKDSLKETVSRADQRLAAEGIDFDQLHEDSKMELLKSIHWLWDDLAWLKTTIVPENEAEIFANLSEARNQIGPNSSYSSSRE